MAAEYCITHTQLVCARLEARVWPGDLQRGYFARIFVCVFCTVFWGRPLCASRVSASRPRHAPHAPQARGRLFCSCPPRAPSSLGLATLSGVGSRAALDLRL